MRVLSLFSGVGGFDLGLERAGMTVIAQAENDPYCLKQLARHWPGVTRFTDVRSVNADNLTDASVGSGSSEARGGLGVVDLVCGGFPCQDVSVAGKRAGLDGARSGLWFEFQRILSELRPRWCLIENVPGLLSSNQGRDFGVILDGLGECGFGGIAWAVLDSQHFGVAQRRRRVFIVGGPDRRSVEQVLSLCESCGGHPAPRRTAGEDVAGEVGDGLAKPLLAKQGWRLNPSDDNYIPEISPALTQRDYKSQREDIAEPAFIAQAVDLYNGAIDGDTAMTLRVATQHHDSVPAVLGAAVRRLTPVECARLQGFPDDWLDGADGPQYRALGNAVSVPVIEYIGKRIMAVEA